MRYRGLAKREVSRKSRLLHHMYTWLRILGESTYVLHDYTNVVQSIPATLLTQPTTTIERVPQEQHSNGQNSRLDDFLRVESHQSDSDLEIEVVKEPQASLRDIHLEDSRDNPNTMFNEIYGVSETWLSLLSQTTRLANRMEAMNAHSSGDRRVTDLLWRRAGRLEDMICSFASSFSPRSTAPKVAPNNHMHRALNSALVIFFYSRVRNVNPWVLQGYVDDVISALRSFDDAIIEKSWKGSGCVWPAFIAACVANTPARRDDLFHWIDKGSTLTGFHPYHDAKDLLQNVWNKRDNIQASNSTTSGERLMSTSSRTSQSSSSWVDVCRERKFWLMAF